MGGKGSGTGSPNWFHCARARRQRYHPRQYKVTLTGRTKPHRPSRAIGSRHTFTSYEYVCDACGYRGYSSHIDLARQAGDEAAMRKRGMRL